MSPEELADKDAGRQLAELAPGEKFDVISLTFGGNDLGFATKLEVCLGATAGSYLAGGSAGAALVGALPCINESSVRAQLPQLRTKLAALYSRAIERLRPGGRVYVLGYPRLFAPSNTWALWVRATTCSGIKAADADRISGLGGELNDAIQQAARYAGSQVAYVPVDDLFATHELCGTGQDWINSFPTLDANENRGGVLALDNLNPSFHPKQQGHDAEAARLAARVNAGLGPSSTGIPKAFIGTWHVHGSTAEFSSDGTGIERSHDGFTNDQRWIDEVVNYTLRPSPDGASVIATVTKIHWVAYDNQTHAPTEISDPDPPGNGDSVGDVWAFHFERAGLLKREPLHRKYPWDGNPYLCGEGLADKDTALCGA